MIGLGWTSVVGAQSLDRADFSALGPEGAILSVVPPLQFNVDERLKKNVEFWVKVYTQYTTEQGLIHDAKYIDHIFEVLDLKTISGKPSKAAQKSKKKWKEVLLSLHRKQNSPEKFTPEEKKIFDLYQDIHEPNKFLNAAHRKRLRFQLGQKDRFLDGIYQSGRYLSKMEEIFKRDRMPIELTRLPFVESSFNVKARSKVGASGIWQFMKSTARLFIKIDPVADERNDPIRATEAASRLLRLNFESLRSWPLAVTAYNHGRKGMMRAVRRVGSDELEELVEEYHSRSFGFASSNFFTELLAAIEVEKNAEKYFGKVERAPALSFGEVILPDYIQLKELSKRTHQDLKILKDLNPGLSESVFTGKLLMPAGYALRIPCAKDQDSSVVVKAFFDSYAEIPGHLKLKAQYGTKVKKFRLTDR